MEKDEMKCLSCNKVIKARNLKRHSKAKLHLKNVEKKVDAMKRNCVSGKLINSIVAVGDVIEVEHCGEKGIYKVEQFKVILNNPHTRPIDFVIHVEFSYNNGLSSIECTSDNFKYIRHISHYL